MPKQDDIVTVKNYPGQTFKILDLKGSSATIRRFDVSRQTLGDLILTVQIADIRPYKEDASQAAARVVREATEGK